MDFQNDPELEKLFKDELDERANALVEGARAMASGELTPELAGTMLREGHTIKGTGRVMGYEAIARGGEASEFIWRWIQQGDLEPSSMLARTLEHLAESIPNALGGGSSEVSTALDTVRSLIEDPELVDKLPEPLDETDDEAVDDSSEPAVEAAEAEADTADTEIDVIDIEVVDLSDTSIDAVDPEAANPAEAVAAESVIADDNAGESLEDRLARMEAEEAGNADTAESGSPEMQEPVPAANESPDDAVEAILESETTSETEGARVEGDASEEAPGSSASEGSETVSFGNEPLVYEPDENGKLPTPTITYEIVSSAFAGASDHAATQPSIVAQDGPPELALVEETVLSPENDAVYNLGGLVGAVETWAAEETVPVNAGRLFRMINDTAALRIDLSSAISQAAHMLGSAEGVSTAALEGTLESLEIVRRASVSLEDAALGLTSTPLSGVLSTLPQLVKYLSKKVDREVALDIRGLDTVVDRQLVDRIGEVVRQLVVNAVAHGIETPDAREAAGKSVAGQVEVSLSRDDKHVRIAVSDDGAGVDWKAVRELAVSQGLVSDDPTQDELRSALYSDGFSTDPGSSEFTGEGDGLARVTGIVEETFGSMSLDSIRGQGTTFVVTLPTHRALQEAQIFRAGGTSWGIPVSSVVDSVNLSDLTIDVTEKGSFVRYQDESIPYSSFATVVGLDVEGMPSQVLVLQSPTGEIALAVDDVVDSAEVATKDLGPLLSGSDSVVTGVALLGGDETVMLVDAGRLAEKIRDVETRPEGPVHTVLVVDDSQGVRQVVSGVLASHGFSTLTAGSVSDALAVLSKQTVDALVVDFSMPRADGVALIHMVRQRYGHIPVVMLSGAANEEDRNRAERAGADAFFDKADFAKGALVDKLRDLVAAESTDGSATKAS